MNFKPDVFAFRNQWKDASRGNVSQKQQSEISRLVVNSFWLIFIQFELAAGRSNFLRLYNAAFIDKWIILFLGKIKVLSSV